MNCNEYQEQAHTFASYEGYLYPVLGIAEEAGEVAGKFAKAIRDEGGMMTEERRQSAIKELGDVLWMAAEICTNLGVTLEEVMQTNIEKLSDRKRRGVIGGSGDDR